MDYVVYGIADPTVHEVFYVGYTGDLKQRMWYFMEDGKGAVGKRIHEIHTCGAAAAAFELEKTATEAAAKKAKTFWIKTLEKRGVPLLNKEARQGKNRSPATGKEAWDAGVKSERSMEMIEWTYQGKYKEIEEKYGYTREEVDALTAESIAENNFDDLDGFDDEN